MKIKILLILNQQTRAIKSELFIFYLAKDAFFVMSNRNVLELSGARDDVQEASDLRFGCEGFAEELNGPIVDVIVGRDHTQIDWRHIDVFFDADALKQ